MNPPITATMRAVGSPRIADTIINILCRRMKSKKLTFAEDEEEMKIRSDADNGDLRENETDLGV